MMSQEQRRQARHPLLQYLDVIDADGHCLLGHLGDISHQGMMLLSTCDLEPGQRRSVLIAYQEPGQATCYIRAQIEVRWNRPSLNPQWRCIGCRFLALHAETASLIASVTRYYGFTGAVEVRRVGG